MTYPIYEIEELKWVSKNGNFEIADFADFISGLVERESLLHEAEIGVAKFVIRNGTNSLSEKQRNVLEIIVKKYADENCNRCGLKIPISEIIESLDNGGYCDYCAHQIAKEKD